MSTCLLRKSIVQSAVSAKHRWNFAIFTLVFCNPKHRYFGKTFVGSEALLLVLSKIIHISNNVRVVFVLLPMAAASNHNAEIETALFAPGSY